MRVLNNVKIGDVVLIKNKLVPPSQWPLARIVELHLGRDRVVRVVTVETAKATYKRPIPKIVQLVNSTDEGYQMSMFLASDKLRYKI